MVQPDKRAKPGTQPFTLFSHVKTACDSLLVAVRNMRGRECTREPDNIACRFLRKSKLCWSVRTLQALRTQGLDMPGHSYKGFLQAYPSLSTHPEEGKGLPCHDPCH